MFSRAASVLFLSALAMPSAAGPRLQKVEWTTSDTATIAANGTLRIEGTLGDLNVETCDCTDVRIGVTRYRYADDSEKAEFEKGLKEISVSVKQENGGPVVTAIFPHREFWVKLIKGRTSANVEYRIQVPKGTNLTIHHGSGAVLLMETGGNLDVSADHGDIVTQLPSPGDYAIDARVGVGRVDSDFDGGFHHKHIIGESFVTKTTSDRHVKLRLNCGDISIQQALNFKYS